MLDLKQEIDPELDWHDECGLVVGPSRKAFMNVNSIDHNKDASVANHLEISSDLPQ